MKDTFAIMACSECLYIKHGYPDVDRKTVSHLGSPLLKSTVSFNLGNECNFLMVVSTSRQTDLKNFNIVSAEFFFFFQITMKEACVKATTRYFRKPETFLECIIFRLLIPWLLHQMHLSRVPSQIVLCLSRLQP